MGRATRKKSEAGARRPEWVWQEESLPPGQIFSGRGRDGRIFLSQSGDNLLRLGEGIDYDLPGQLDPETLFVASGENLFALSGKDLLALYSSEESERCTYFIHGQPLALFPTRDGMRVVHRSEDEGILQNDFSEGIVSPLGDYVLAPWQEEVILETLEAPGGGGIALARPGELLYSGPTEKSWTLPDGFQPGWISASGDPYDPDLFLLSRDRRLLWMPEEETVRLPGAARGWDSNFGVFVASTEDYLQRIDKGQQIRPLGPYENLQGCRVLPGRRLLLATERGLLQVAWDGSEEAVLREEPCAEIELALLDEAEAEILVDGGDAYLRGELE